MMSAATLAFGRRADLRLAPSREYPLTRNRKFLADAPESELEFLLDSKSMPDSYKSKLLVQQTLLIISLHEGDPHVQIIRRVPFFMMKSGLFCYDCLMMLELIYGNVHLGICMPHWPML